MVLMDLLTYLGLRLKSLSSPFSSMGSSAGMTAGALLCAGLVVFGADLAMAAHHTTTTLVSQSENVVCRLVELIGTIRIWLMVVAVGAIVFVFSQAFFSGRIPWSMAWKIVIGILAVSAAGALVTYFVDWQVCQAAGGTDLDQTIFR